ncbi:MAG: VOC family protein [Candidatus Lambdaproteobacteria bacterium]|nr:VOC family protein [Candidatus Lambdaproteobacteria bacterium]
MLDRVDRVQVAVADRARAARTYRTLLGAEIAREEPSAYLRARRTILALGESEVELCEPDGEGRAADALRSRGEGLLSAGVCTSRPDALRRRLTGLGCPPAEDGGQLYLEPETNHGLRFVISPTRPRSRVGPVSFLYEVTNTLRSDWRRAAAQVAAMFGLDPARFSAIHSARFGYEGTLTLFNPPERLDRIELSQVTADASASAMARWAGKHGDSLYMCYCETHDLPAVIARLEGAGARWTPRGPDPARERDGLWVHPAGLHGVLLGVSRTTLSWGWSGHPELVLPTP